MSWRDAPLYVEAHDLAGWILERAEGWNGRGEQIGRRVTGAACDLVDAVTLALTFPERRAADLERADAAVAVLRTRLRLAQRLGLVSARGLRFACGRLQAIGRMVGGWRKRVTASALGSAGGTDSIQETGRRRPARDARRQLLE